MSRETDVTTPTYDSRFLQGIQYFNECEFYEAHDIWEELWADYQGPSRYFYQGLIQLAVCLHHFGNGNIRGAKKLYFSCRKYLEPYGAFHHGVDLHKLLAQLQECCQDVIRSEEEYPNVEIDPDLIPEIHLDPPP
jgi:predicted metal-dependent hydrolase